MRTRYLEYEQLPYAERQQIKGRRALSFVMQGKEPTLAQLAYLRSLGYQGAPPADRAAGIVLIDQLRQTQRGWAMSRAQQLPLMVSLADSVRLQQDCDHWEAYARDQQDRANTLAEENAQLRDALQGRAGPQS